MKENEFQYLQKPSNCTSGDFMFHIGRNTILRPGLTHLIPRSLLPGYKKPRPDLDSCDDHRVDFAVGNIDLLSKFFVGHAFSWDRCKDVNKKEIINLIPSKWAIAVTEKKYGKYDGNHGIVTAYEDSHSDSVDFIKVFSLYEKKAPLFGIINFPRGGFNNKQILELYSNGEEYYLSQMHKYPNTGHPSGSFRWWPFMTTPSKEEVVRMYGSSKQVELSVKFALLKFLSDNVGNASKVPKKELSDLLEFKELFGVKEK